MLFVLIWLLLGVISLLIFIIWAWYEGSDVTVSDIPVLAMMSIAGPLSVMIIIAMVCEYIKNSKKVLIKGRNKSKLSDN